MKICRDHYFDKAELYRTRDAMKHAGTTEFVKKTERILVLLLIAVSLCGCKPSKSVDFCEGTSTKGDGVKCGSVFTTGELTAVIKAEKNFGVESLDLKVYDIGKKSTEPVDSRPIKVKQEDRKAVVNLSFYNEGKYRVRVLNGDGRAVADGDVEIVDTY